jgi:hypothetical protein
MKAELVADSAEANPFPYKAKTNERAKRGSPRKTLAAEFQSIHFLPAQQPISQTSRALPAIIPVRQELNQLKNKSAREKALDSLRCQQE